MEVKASPFGMTEKLSNKFANMALVCSFLVVFIHCEVSRSTTSINAIWWYNQIHNAFCPIAVPFFFVAAGFF